MFAITLIRPKSMRAYLVAATCTALVNACGGPIGPAQVALPLDSLEMSGIPQSGTVGDRFPLKVTATDLHGETAEVTSKVTWTSTSEATAAVQGGELRLVGAGEAEIRASLEQVSAFTRVSVAQRSPDTGFNRVRCRKDRIAPLPERARHRRRGVRVEASVMMFDRRVRA
ncbi:MAG TPA: hypothetical protein VFO48_06210 [Vicinamibacterales bacterium]|nr:hypothetical protein [Vicinamibacterales bacterium]